MRKFIPAAVAALLWIVGCSPRGQDSASIPLSAPRVPDAPAKAEARSGKPNVLLILTDDQGWGDIRSHGNEKIHTPTLDALAASGARFDRFFVSPVCAPTRASLLTGRYHMRTGVHGVTRGAETMRAEEVTLAEVFKTSGYATGIFGKWHNGAHYPHHPNGQGFDEFVGFCAGHWNNYFDTTLERNGEPIKTRGYITDVLTDHALDFIERHKNKPFFCYVPYNAPHSPWQVPDKYFDKYKAKGFDDRLACCYGMVENIDDNVARLLKYLDDAGLAENTIVLFLTDNGPNTDRYNGGMKGRKGSVHEGGVRVPLFVRWPGKVKPGTEIKHIAAHIDILPTLVDLCDLPEPETLPLDGMSVAPLITGQALNFPSREIYTYWRGKRAIRTPELRYVKEGRRWEAYEIPKDPGEQRNVVRANAGELASLGHAFAGNLRAMIGDGFKPAPIEVGHPEAPTVTLPGHEAFLAPKAGEGISYVGSSGWANDWITNWTDTQAHPWWPVKVVREGRYRVQLRYACAKQNVGAEVFAQAVPVVNKQAGEPVKTRLVKVTKAHDPEPLPSPDRHPRKEVYEKVWATLDLGEIHLPAGDVRFDVRASYKAGDELIEIKGVRLERVD